MALHSQQVAVALWASRQGDSQQSVKVEPVGFAVRGSSAVHTWPGWAARPSGLRGLYIRFRV